MRMEFVLKPLEILNQEIIACRKCPRLVEWREEVARTKRKAYKDEEYWGKPVPGFGDPQARVLVVGLAPGAHGSNRTGRQFTGDASGGFLYPALYRAGFANQPHSSARGDDLLLKDMYITASGRCAPPGNKPTTEELNIERVQRIYNRKLSFAHGAVYELTTDHWLLASYHPSQQNTLTGKLTVEMFDSIWKKAREIIKKDS
jgi:uracil-DNA glycosylase